MDSNAENLCERSQKAARATKKGGLPNLVYVHAGVESLPEALDNLATSLTILLPWGSLLKAAAGQNITILKNIANICRIGADLRVIFGYETSSEPTVVDKFKLPLLTTEYLNSTLKQAYLQAGFDVRCRFISKYELKTVDSTWAKKLAYGKERQFVEIIGKKIISTGP